MSTPRRLRDGYDPDEADGSVRTDHGWVDPYDELSPEERGRATTGPSRGCPWGCACPRCVGPVRDLTTTADTCPGCVAWRATSGERLLAELHDGHVAPVAAAHIYVEATHTAHERHRSTA